MSALDESADIEPCPHCGETSGVKAVTGISPNVRAWRCVDCDTDWAFTVVNPHLRQRYLDELAAEVAARVVLRDVIALREQADTLTQGQLRTRAIGLLVRLDQICRRGATGARNTP